MDPVMGILEIARRKGMGVAEEYKSLAIFPSETTPHSFKEFLLDKRIKPFLRLHLLATHEGEVHIGFEEFTVSEYDYENDGDEPEKRELARYGPTLIMQPFTSEEIFDTIISRFGIESIIAENALYQDYKLLPFPKESANGTVPECPESVEEGERELLILGGIIITEDDILIDAADESLQGKARNILSHHFAEMQHIMEEEDSTSIPHRVYVELLMKWFPGRIRTRQLSFDNTQ